MVVPHSMDLSFLFLTFINFQNEYGLDLKDCASTLIVFEG